MTLTFSSVVSRLTQRKSDKEPVETERYLSVWDLTAYGIAATVGGGIFGTMGYAAHLAGPANIISTLLAGLIALVVAFCYLEFSSSLPWAGSAYLFAYSSLGEFAGWMVGWNLTLEYAMCAAAIAAIWAQTIARIVEQSGAVMPSILHDHSLVDGVFHVCLIAPILLFFVGILALQGLKMGAKVTIIVTIMNLALILFIIVTGATYVSPSNWSDFAPSGISPIFSGTAVVIFSYLGFDTVSTLAGDAKNPRRDVPIAVLVTIGVATLLYMAAGFVIAGMLNTTTFQKAPTMQMVFSLVGATWPSYVVGVGALTACLAVIIACVLGQPKIFHAIAMDGLLPRAFTKTSKSGTLYFGVIITIFIAAVCSTLFSSGNLIDVVAMGILFSMSITCSGLIARRFHGAGTVEVPGKLLLGVYFVGCIVASILCFNGVYIASGVIAVVCVLLPFVGLCAMFYRHRDILKSKYSGFTCPLMPLFPCVAIASSSFFMVRFSLLILYGLLIWIGLGVIVYVCYGYRYSAMNVSAIKADNSMTKLNLAPSPLYSEKASDI